MATDLQRAASARLRQKRREIIWAGKDKPCADCGGRFHFAAMQFDHVNGDRGYSINGPGRVPLASQPYAVIHAEIAKCEVVCANCHAVRTWERRQDGRTYDKQATLA